MEVLADREMTVILAGKAAFPPSKEHSKEEINVDDKLVAMLVVVWKSSISKQTAKEFSSVDHVFAISTAQWSRSYG